MFELLIFLSGVLASMIGFGFVNFIFIPLKQFSEVRAKIGRELLYYSNIITSPGAADTLANEASITIRHLAVELEEKYLLIVLREVFVKLHIIPSIKLIILARGNLFFIANGLSAPGGTEDNMEALAKIYTSLDIKELQKRYNQNYQDAVEFRKAYLGKRYRPFESD